MTPADVLRAARAMIATPGAWNTVDPAVDQDGRIVSVDSDDARRWCAYGAIDRVYLRAGASGWTALGATDAFHSAIKSTAIGAWNDSHTHAEVLAAFDRAIALAEGAS